MAKAAKVSSKIVLCILTVLFWGVAAGLSYIAANIFMTYERFGDTFTYLHSVVPAFILIGKLKVAHAYISFFFVVVIVLFFVLFLSVSCLVFVDFFVAISYKLAVISTVLSLIKYKKFSYMVIS